MEQGQVDIGPLLPAGQQAAGAVRPGVAAFDDPAAGLGVRMAFRRLFAFVRNMRDVAATSDRFSNGLRVVSFIGTEMLLAAA